MALPTESSSATLRRRRRHDRGVNVSAVDGLETSKPAVNDEKFIPRSLSVSIDHTAPGDVVSIVHQVSNDFVRGIRYAPANVMIDEAYKARATFY
jgi:hypothetical protein